MSNPWVVPAQPVVLNYRCRSAEAAAKIPLRDLHLVECSQCGLIFNASFDENLIHYDADYDNIQSYSEAFQRHVSSCIIHLTENYSSPTAGSVVVEAGCGKGAYLKQLCAISGWHGRGYDTTCEIVGESDHNTFFIKRRATEHDIHGNVHAIVCRHVIEHVSDVGAFLRLLHSMAVAGGAEVIYIETPAWEWTVENEAFWDIFHEHCNYFTSETLRHLAEQAGFRVLEHFTTFGGQYQSLYLGTGAASSAPDLGSPPPVSLHAFALQAGEAHERLLQTLTAAGASAHPYAIWGAGAKGVTLANRLHHAKLAPSVIIDSNPGKSGSFVPGVGIPVHTPRAEVLRDVPLILVPNPNYLPEIKATLTSMGLNPTLVTV
ncbi:MAG TPA: class I SAM-dependent methyltransferase [Candidatus Saccharimonadia bacterium]|nr:class I SAM-dependent methyltransferase [Candidatus Saccharimonadia bacterium]